MKKLSDLQLNDLVKVFANNEKLYEKLSDYVSDYSMDFISTRLDFLKDGLKDWSIGLYNYDFFKRCSNCSIFIDAVCNYKDHCGLSDECSKLLDKCIEFRDADECFGYETDDESEATIMATDQLCDMVFEEEFQRVIKEIERCLYKTDCVEFRGYVADFVNYFDDYYVKDDGTIIKIETICNTAS